MHSSLTVHVPRRNGYFYYDRTEEGKQYTVHCRRKVKDDSSPSTGENPASHAPSS